MFAKQKCYEAYLEKYSPKLYYNTKLAAVKTSNPCLMSLVKKKKRLLAI